MTEMFNVIQYSDVVDFQEYVRRNVSLDDACKAFDHYTNNVAVRMGWTEWVRITDSGDCTVREWRRGQGVTFR